MPKGDYRALRRWHAGVNSLSSFWGERFACRRIKKSATLLEESNYPGDANALRLRLTRYAHAHSHSETPATDIVVSPDEVSSAISAAFEFMNFLDPHHFVGLCEVANIDPKILLSVGDPLEPVELS